MWPSDLKTSIKAHDLYGCGLHREFIDNLYALARRDYYIAVGPNWENIKDKDHSSSCSVHRVYVRPDKSAIEIVNFDTFSLASDISGVYIEETDLPDWAIKKLSVLLFCDWKRKPTMDIDGVGRRIDEHTFWIYNDCC